MQDWVDYVRWFYSLSVQRQQAEWEKLTPDQKRQFEAARASAMMAGSGESQSPIAVRKSSTPKAAAIGCAVILACGVLLFGGLALLSHFERREEQMRAREQARLEAEEVQATINDFRQNANQILAKSSELLASGEIQQAIDLTQKYLVSDDPELTELHERAKAELAEIERREKIQEILSEVRQLPATQVVENRDLYRQLLELDPGEPLYAEKLRFYSGKVEEQAGRLRQEQKRHQEEREREEEQRQLRAANFGAAPVRSSWDGSYRPVRQYLLQVANDPDSIEIDGCTGVYHTDDGWLVGCDYRGRNAFGGMIRQSNWFTIRDGRVVEMHAASAYKP